MKHFHNTTQETGEKLKDYTRKAVSQERYIHNLFIIADKPMTASQVYLQFSASTPITSIRRAMSNLKEQGVLEKLEDKATGLYGHPEHYYRLIK